MIIALPYVIIHYAIWHYTEAIRELILIWRNLIWFLWNFFSVPLLLGTLFSPWKRMQEQKPAGLDLEAIGGMIVINLILRLVGFFMRLFIACIGLFSMAVFFVGAVSSIVVWVLLPLVIPSLISAGIASLFI